MVKMVSQYQRDFSSSRSLFYTSWPKCRTENDPTQSYAELSNSCGPLAYPHPTCYSKIHVFVCQKVYAVQYMYSWQFLKYHPKTNYNQNIHNCKSTVTPLKHTFYNFSFLLIIRKLISNFLPMGCSILVAALLMVISGESNFSHYASQPSCQHRLSQATTPSTNRGHHWHCMAKEHPFEGNYEASTNTRATPNAMKTNSRKCQTVHARPQLEPVGFSQLVLVLDL